MQPHPTTLSKIFLVIVALAILVPAAAQAAVRPDNRPGPRGANPPLLALRVRPDDRAGIRGIQTTPTANPQAITAIRPDDRAGLRGAPDIIDRFLYTHATTSTSASTRFAWLDAAIGAALGLAGTLIALAALRTLHRPDAAATA